MSTIKDFERYLLMNELSIAMRMLSEQIALTRDDKEAQHLMNILTELVGCFYNIVHLQ
jgi:hypothetical protein